MTMTTGNTEADNWVESALDDVYNERAYNGDQLDASVSAAAYAAGRLAIVRADLITQAIERGLSDDVHGDDSGAITAVWGAHIAGAAYAAGVLALGTGA